MKKLMMLTMCVLASGAAMAVPVEFRDYDANTGTFTNAVRECTLVTSETRTSENRLSDVDPLIGTGQTVDGVASCEKGATMPYVGVPFGSVMWVPMTRESQFGTLAFNQQDTKLIGFAASRQMAVAMGEWGEFSFLPTMGSGTPSTDFATRGQTISAKLFTPYSGSVSAGGVKTDYTATAHAAIYRITFPGNATRQPQIVFDASRDDMFRRFPNTATNQLGGLTISDGGQTVVAWNTDNTDWYRSKPMPGYRARFRMEFSEKPVGYATYRHVVTEDGTNTVTEAGTTSVEADACGATFTFAQSSQVRTIFVKCSVSLVSDENLKSLMDEEIVAWDFDGTLNEAKAAWNEKFDLLKFSSGDSDVTKTLATAIYHALQWPRDVTEFGRHYSPSTDDVRDGVMFTGQSMWDTYRAENALLGFLVPDRIGDMMRALVNVADESGRLPLCPNPGDTSSMAGAPGEVQLAEAVQKGWLTGADADAAYAAAKRNATEPTAMDAEVTWRDQEWWTGSVEGRGGLSTYRSLGYVACDKTCQSVSRTQDFSHADDAMARFAAFLGKTDDAAFFTARSHSWTNLWNRDERNVAPRNAAGAFCRPEDCVPDGNPADGAYGGAGAEQARWAVPHDVPTLVALLGGTDAAVRELDGYEASVTRTKDGIVLHDDHGNGSAHHIPYLYNLLGRHDACAKAVREIMADYYPSERQWRRGPDGCVQTSAWYVFSALGFYPVNPVDLTYRIGSPLVDSAELAVGNGKTLSITVTNQGKASVYVKSVKLNGVELVDRTITHDQILAGGTLAFEMSETPVMRQDPVSYIDADGVEKTKSDGEFDIVTAETRELTSGWYAVMDNVVFPTNANLAVQGDVHLILCDEATLAITNKSTVAAVSVGTNATLTIYGQTQHTGRLEAKNGNSAAGIGGDKSGTCGTIAIHGGTVKAEGGTYSAGIGGGMLGNGGTVTITGGRIAATGHNNAADIGSAYGARTSCEVSISGGVFARELQDAWLAAGFAAVTNTDVATAAEYPWAIADCRPRVSPDAPLGPYATETEATDALARAVFAPDEEVADVLTTQAARARYAGWFGLDVAEGGDDEWYVEAVLTDAAKSHLVAIATAATRQIPVASIAAMADNATTNVVVTGCEPGFYYTLHDGVVLTDVVPGMANCDELCGGYGEVAFPAVGKPSDAAGFFRVGVNVTK